ncbi:LCP family glycopolymer transferase [Streptomyces sp. H27-D2]|uniref:LCP family glycopolymer transferase n=1 Tax=Streptomyces sp. H27-D2 TaxID=3046304 RepID=UPI002DBB29C7|nr:LCP family protein [Streptomyces sp. H27-D2]MEC4019803.1 LCP family protein [Streptomyces sp. H27-D2]
MKDALDRSPERDASAAGQGGDVAEPMRVTGPLWHEDPSPSQPPTPRDTPPYGYVPEPPHGYVPEPPHGYVPETETAVPSRRQPGSRGEYGGYGIAVRRGPRHRVSRPKRRRALRRTALTLLVTLLAIPTGTFLWADIKLNRQVDLGASGARHPAGEGTNYLIVGSDSRAGLTDEEKRELHTGSAAGRRTDSMILLHTGSVGTTMVSLPRDSWVTIPGFTNPRTGKHTGPAKNKLNAAFALGGAKMLVRTVERNTGLKIDHNVEVGFAGVVNLVNAVGGVPMCLDRDIKDKKSGADLKKGCQTLDGTAALAFVRQRHQEARGDLGRSRNQQKFLSALAREAATPGTVLNPFDLYPALNAGLNTLIVDRQTGLRDLTSMFEAIHGVTGGQGKQINVPVANPGLRTSKGSAALWNEAQAGKLFSELRNDRPVTLPPKSAR